MLLDNWEFHVIKGRILVGDESSKNLLHPYEAYFKFHLQ